MNEQTSEVMTEKIIIHGYESTQSNEEGLFSTIFSLMNNSPEFQNALHELKQVAFRLDPTFIMAIGIILGVIIIRIGMAMSLHHAIRLKKERRAKRKSQRDAKHKLEQEFNHTENSPSCIQEANNQLMQTSAENSVDLANAELNTNKSTQGSSEAMADENLSTQSKLFCFPCQNEKVAKLAESRRQSVSQIPTTSIDTEGLLPSSNELFSSLGDGVIFDSGMERSLVKCVESDNEHPNGVDAENVHLAVEGICKENPPMQHTKSNGTSLQELLGTSAQNSFQSSKFNLPFKPQNDTKVEKPNFFGQARSLNLQEQMMQNINRRRSIATETQSIESTGNNQEENINRRSSLENVKRVGKIQDNTKTRSSEEFMMLIQKRASAQRQNSADNEAQDLNSEKSINECAPIANTTETSKTSLLGNIFASKFREQKMSNVNRRRSIAAESQNMDVFSDVTNERNVPFATTETSKTSLLGNTFASKFREQKMSNVNRRRSIAAESQKFENGCDLTNENMAPFEFTETNRNLLHNTFTSSVRESVLQNIGIGRSIYTDNQHEESDNNTKKMLQSPSRRNPSRSCRTPVRRAGIMTPERPNSQFEDTNDNSYALNEIKSPKRIVASPGKRKTPKKNKTPKKGTPSRNSRKELMNSTLNFDIFAQEEDLPGL